MPLQSELFKNSVRLQRCATQDSAHVTLNDIGDHVGRIQAALSQLDGSDIDSIEAAKKRYGSSTARAVLGYKTARKIINHAYQSKADDIVGKMTITAMDKELTGNAVRPAVSRMTTNFLPTYRRTTAGTFRVASSSDQQQIGPIGPMLRRNGYDPDPDNAHVPGLSWQMVPVGGERHLFLGAPPWQRSRFALDNITGSDPTQIVALDEVVPSSVAGLQEVRLVGKKPGWAQLTAYNLSDGKPTAQLSIDVLDAKTYKFGFAELSDPSHRTKMPHAAPDDFIKKYNSIWTPQANISGKFVGSAVVNLVADLGDEPSQDALIAIAPTIRASVINKVGPCDRVFAIIWGMVKPSLVGLGVDVIFLREKVQSGWSTFAHEFGHTVGLTHEMAGTYPFNLMTPGERLDMVQVVLNREEIMKANTSPGTWRDVLQVP